jgi:hypothetical protein
VAVKFVRTSSLSNRSVPFGMTWACMSGGHAGEMLVGHFVPGNPDLLSSSIQFVDSVPLGINRFRSGTASRLII